MLTLVPVTLRAANAFIGEHHRHNLPVRGWIVGVGVQDEGGGLVAVGILGRTVARGADDGRTAEVTRVCTIGAPHAASMVYGALCRAAKALGYHRVITYTLQEEPGTSLRAAGFEVDAKLAARPAWERSEAGQGRYQTDLFGNDRRPPGPKIRWVRRLTSEA